jgi:hypothetical protein
MRTMRYAVADSATMLRRNRCAIALAGYGWARAAFRREPKL